MVVYASSSSGISELIDSSLKMNCLKKHVSCGTSWGGGDLSEVLIFAPAGVVGTCPWC